MHTDLPQLPRIPQRPEKEPDVEVEIWQPEWSCFCCHDSGIIVPHLVRKIIPDYNENKDKFPRCQKPGCRSGSQYDSEALRCSTDTRIDPLFCKKLDSLERSSWRDTLFVHGQRAKLATQDLAREKSLRKCDRSAEEDRAIQQRHRLVTEEDWGLAATTPAQKKWIDGWEGEG